MMRVLELILRLYPPDFRERYGAEMREVIDRGYERASRQDRRSRYLARTLLGLTANALLAWMDLGVDFRSARRSIRRAPGFATLVVVVVAAAVAIVTATAGFYRGTLLSPRSYDDPGRLVFAWGSNVENGQLRDVVSGPNFLDLRRESRTLETLAAVHAESAVLLKDGRPQVLDALEVSVDFLDVLGVAPALGGDFGDEHRQSGGPEAVILSHALWRELLGGDPAAMGRTLVLNGSPHTILGVLAPEFEFLSKPQLLLPLREDQLESEDRTFHNYWLVGRLLSGSTVDAATRDLSLSFARIAREDPRLSGWSVLVERVDQVSVTAVRPLLIALGAGALLLLLAAAANLANLNLVRTFGRSRELHLRRVLGALPSDLARLLLVETALHALLGAMAGLALGIVLLEGLARVVPSSIPIPESAAMVLAVRAEFDFTVVMAGLFSALLLWAHLFVPALLHLRGTRLTGAPRGVRLMVAIELALATVLWMGAGLLSRAADHLLSIDPGVDPEKLLTFYVGELDEPDPAARARYFREVVRSVEEAPGVLRAGATDYVPFQGEDDFMGFRLEDRPPPKPGQGLREEWRRLTEGYFDAAGIAVVRGRGFVSADYERPPAVAVVNEAFARKYWPSSDAIGRRMRIALREYGLLEVVGIVEDVPERGPAEPAPPMFFAPLHGLPRDNMAIFVRVSEEPLAVLDRVREAVWAVDSSQPIDRIFPMAALVDGTVALPRLARKLVAQLAGLALGFGALGLFGVSSYAVRTRRPQLGIRLALGATPRRLQRDLLSEVLPLASFGVASGLGIGVGAAHVGRALLHGISPADPFTVAGTALLVGAAALFAIYLPARRIAEIDPAATIRAL